MKKILSLAACTALVLGFAGTASAIHMEAPANTSTVVAKGGSVTVDGNIQMRGTSESNGATEARHNSQSFYEGRVRLGVHAQTSDAISGYMLLESGQGINDHYIWGENSELPASLVNGGTKKGGLDILEAWINYMPSNWGVKVGHMPLSLGDKLFYDHTAFGDDAIVAYMNMGDTTHLGALTFKINEGNSFGGAGGSSADADAYTAFAIQKVSDALSLGANYTYVHIGGSASQFLNSALGAPATGSDAVKFSNLGINVDGKVGPVSYGLDGEFQFGHFLDLNGDGSPDKAKGMAFLGKANMDLGAANVGALVGWGSGDDNPADNDQKTFINFLSSDVNYFTMIVGDRMTFEGGDSQQGLSNMLLLQLNGSMATKCPISGKDLDLKATVSYMKKNKVVADSKTIGTELDLMGTWKLGNGLTYSVEGGYLWAGNAFDSATYYDGSGKKDAYSLRNTLELAF